MLEGDGKLVRSFRSHGITLQVRQMSIAPTSGSNLESTCAWLLMNGNSQVQPNLEQPESRFRPPAARKGRPTAAYRSNVLPLQQRSCIPLGREREGCLFIFSACHVMLGCREHVVKLTPASFRMKGSWDWRLTAKLERGW